MGGLIHASFFSGAGGTDLGLERAGWRTVSFSEIDAYASAVLAERWPGVVNLGDITAIDDVPAAELWTGGFPCQDLSVAGKRRGFAGERSVLALTFIALVERHRPAAVLLENVPGLLSSHAGRDMATLVGRLVDIGYGVAWRVLDAQYFGVPQRRRRVFIVALRSDPDDADGRLAAERASEVLSVGTRCERHPATGHQAGQDVAERARGGIDVAHSITGTSGKHHDPDLDTLVSTPTDAGRMRATDGMARRSHDRADVGQQAFVKAARAQTVDDDESWVEGRVMPTLNSFDVGDARTTAAILSPTLESNRTGGYRFDADGAESLQVSDAQPIDDELLPLGLDSHRYRCCGNGVVAPVAEWLGRRLADALA